MESHIVLLAPPHRHTLSFPTEHSLVFSSPVFFGPSPAESLTVVAKRHSKLPATLSVAFPLLLSPETCERLRVG